MGRKSSCMGWNSLAEIIWLLPNLQIRPYFHIMKDASLVLRLMINHYSLRYPNLDISLYICDYLTDYCCAFRTRDRLQRIGSRKQENSLLPVMNECVFRTENTRLRMPWSWVSHKGSTAMFIRGTIYAERGALKSFLLLAVGTHLPNPHVNTLAIDEH